MHGFPQDFLRDSFFFMRGGSADILVRRIMKFNKIDKIIGIKSNSGLCSEKVTLCRGLLHIPCIVPIDHQEDTFHVFLYERRIMNEFNNSIKKGMLSLRLCTVRSYINATPFSKNMIEGH